MTQKETTEILKNLKLYMQVDDLKSDYKFPQYAFDAIDNAIKSLEAWDKLQSEIYNLAVGSMELHTTDSQNFILIRESDVLNLINKHLAEVTQ